MSLSSASPNRVGVIGAGGFGIVIANLLARNANVLLYVRNKEKAHTMVQTRKAAGQELLSTIDITNNLEDITRHCSIIFPIIPSQEFKSLLQQLKPLLAPDHILIHGIKGLAVDCIRIVNPGLPDLDLLLEITRLQVKTMSELIKAEAGLTRIGCIAGPNLAAELAEGQLAAVVIASTFPEVIEQGKRLLQSDNFQVYTNTDITGVELCGVLKNIIAIGAGCLSGLGYGENAKAFLISRGLAEMIYIGKAMGATVQPFLGLAGIGDLIATCSSKLSRNYTVGYRLAKGETLAQILQNNSLTAEGIYTVQIVRSLMHHYKMRAPITEMMYRILFEGLSVQKAITYLMKYPLKVDVDFI